MAAHVGGAEWAGGLKGDLLCFVEPSTSVLPCSRTHAAHHWRAQFLHLLIEQLCRTPCAHFSQTSRPLTLVTRVVVKSCPPSLGSPWLGPSPSASSLGSGSIDSCGGSLAVVLSDGFGAVLGRTGSPEVTQWPSSLTAGASRLWLALHTALPSELKKPNLPTSWVCPHQQFIGPPAAVTRPFRQPSSSGPSPG